MKVILVKDHFQVGRLGEVVNIANGFARNFLIPRGIAVEATNANIRQLEAEKDSLFKKAAKTREKAERTAGELSMLKLCFTRKAGDDERLFGSVTAMDIESAIKGYGMEIDRKIILLDEPIKRLGNFTVDVRLHPEVRASLNVWIVKEE
ncbi:MAG: 50S ribosomal protein L9 [Deltaproteobacteria bacterium]|nr:50S ribosomal protein L9 [Deltaproteobacteria bacterium]